MRNFLCLTNPQIGVDGADSAKASRPTCWRSSVARRAPRSGSDASLDESASDDEDADVESTTE
eukprot:8731800-Heterocapsa_arctica.AAC.1